MSPESKSNFRAIVVRAGVAGITASHTLQKAGIDHVVLERGRVAPEEGASIAIYHHGARILEQLDYLEGLKKECFPMDRYKNRGPDGKVLVNSAFFDYVKENHGHDILLLERRVFLQSLYNALPDKSFIQLDRKVTGIIDDCNGVEVRLEDRGVERGDVVIGCDGVHSVAREKMWEYANKADPGTITVQEKKSISTTWKCLIGMGPSEPGMGEKDMTVIHNDQHSILILTQPDKTFFFVFFRLDSPFSWPKRVRYSEADAEEAAAQVGDHAVSDTLIFEDLWKKRIRGSLICIEEGVLKRWWYVRTVLVGDAAHKVTPNIALGGNSSIESVAVLVNHLNDVLRKQQGARPSRATLNKALANYQSEREGRKHQIMNYSSLITKLQAWDNPLLKFVTRWVVPYAPDRLIADDLGNIIRTAPKLDFVFVPEAFTNGTVTWADDKSVDEEKVHLPVAMTQVTGLRDAKDDMAMAANLSQSSNGSGNVMQLVSACTALASAAYFMLIVN